MKSSIFFSFYLLLLSVTTINTDPIFENDNKIYICAELVFKPWDAKLRGARCAFRLSS